MAFYSLCDLLCFMFAIYSRIKDWLEELEEWDSVAGEYAVPRIYDAANQTAQSRNLILPNLSRASLPRSHRTPWTC